MNSQSKVAIITGASSGIGKALARELSQQNWSVGLIARRIDRLNELATEISNADGRVEVAAADVSDREQITSAIEALRSSLGEVDLLIANAGVSRPDYLDPFTVDDIELMFKVNTLGVVYAINSVLPQMLKNKSGHIAAVSSSGAYKGMPGSAGYCASKSAVNTFMEGLRIQLREENITLTTICPGFVKTPMTDVNTFKMPWLVEPAEAARRIVSALQRGKKVYNFPWQMAVLVKLFRFLPDWAVARFVPRKSDADRSLFDESLR